MSWTLWLAIAALAVAVVALVVALGLRAQQTRQRRAHGDDAPPVEEPPVEDDPRELVAFVANPSKPDVVGLEALVRAAFADAALPDPLWFETTVEDPGVGQTRAALARGADVVVAVGGDGTVRAVAEGMVGSGRTMGLVPVGTGNLLARNLDLPVGDARAALAVVIAGSDRPVDVGWVKVLRYADVTPAEGDEPGTAPDPARDTDKEHIFLVIAGLGFDAAMVADTDDDLKAKVGWVAYFVAGIRHLHGRRMRARLQLDDTPPVDARLRSLLIGNCGRLPGGLTLLPDAVIDDGILDIAAIDTRGGVVGWAQLFGEVVMQGLGVRNDLPAKIGRIDHARARRVRVRVEGGEQAQVDGDVLGLAVEIEARVDPGALVVRTA
ncbi:MULTISPECIES: diacylglycerol kinase family protein [Cellulosimicrobium]|uniref:Diacylglycerol kinase n=1 Tax=Cellulosimicrobium funkei TaxID=264251 RepID=A0A0H2KQR5_9MICO|nr:MULTISPECIES: diacylglycerol kinase family protein [Cellulosimicrobium]KLN35870.1 diacylglycerol kinase [Cellulosimicrobium funkei]KZM77980.1 diacylglycerol kinase [Cellulosimicrobium sp. I38E]